MKTLPSGPYLRLMICDHESLASRKSGACEPTNPEPLGLRTSRLIRAPWMLFMKSEPWYSAGHEPPR